MNSWENSKRRHRTCWICCFFQHLRHLMTQSRTIRWLRYIIQIHWDTEHLIWLYFVVVLCSFKWQCQLAEQLTCWFKETWGWQKERANERGAFLSLTSMKEFCLHLCHCALLLPSFVQKTPGAWKEWPPAARALRRDPPTAEGGPIVARSAKYLYGKDAYTYTCMVHHLIAISLCHCTALHHIVAIIGFYCSSSLKTYTWRKAVMRKHKAWCKDLLGGSAHTEHVQKREMKMICEKTRCHVHSKEKLKLSLQSHVYA